MKEGLAHYYNWVSAQLSIYTFHNISLSNHDGSVTRETDWLTVTTEERDQSHVNELVTGHTHRLRAI